MRPSKKLFISREPSDDDLEVVKDLLRNHDIKKYLSDSFIYIQLNDEDSVEVLRFPDGAVVKTMKEYYLKPKQAIQMIYHEVEIDQAVKELQYWSNISNYKKYLPVIAEAQMKSGMEKVYADFAIYAKDEVEAGVTLSDMDFEEYLYLEDVDEEEETNNPQ